MRPHHDLPRQKKSCEHFQGGSVANDNAGFPRRQHHREFFQLVLGQGKGIAHAQLLDTVMAALSPSARR